MIQVTNLCKQYGSRRILDGLSFSVTERESVAIVGPSGSGKSTILNILGLLESPTSGEVRIAGSPIPGVNSHGATLLRRHTINYLFQSFALLTDKTVQQNLALGMTYAKLSHAEKRDRAHDLLAALSLEAVQQDRVTTLSGGEQQRVAIARAMLKPGDLVLADEPTGSLDRALADTVFAQLLDAQHRYGKTLVVVTHDPAIAARCDRVLDLGAVSAGVAA